MERKIISSKGFDKSLESLLFYLENEWSKKVSDNFVRQLEAKVEHIAKYPETGMPAKKKWVRSTPIGKHNRVYYSFNSNAVKLLLLRDMRMNPKSNPFEK